MMVSNSAPGFSTVDDSKAAVYLSKTSVCRGYVDVYSVKSIVFIFQSVLFDSVIVFVVIVGASVVVVSCIVMVGLQVEIVPCNI